MRLADFHGMKGVSMKNLISSTGIALLCAGLGGCAHWSRAEQGTAIGGALGHEIGEDQDRDRRNHYR